MAAFPNNRKVSWTRGRRPGTQETADWATCKKLRVGVREMDDEKPQEAGAANKATQPESNVIAFPRLPTHAMPGSALAALDSAEQPEERESRRTAQPDPRMRALALTILSVRDTPAPPPPSAQKLVEGLSRWAGASGPHRRSPGLISGDAALSPITLCGNCGEPHRAEPRSGNDRDQRPRSWSSPSCQLSACCSALSANCVGQFKIPARAAGRH